MEVLISSIKHEARARSDFGDISSLCTSIKKLGLLHPIVVEKLEDNNEFEYQLVAGERRLTAFIKLKKEVIPATTVSCCTDRIRKEMELEENIQRKDFDWQEQVECLRQLHECKQEEHGIADKSHDSIGWGIQDTALALNRSVGSVAEDLTLANALLKRPDMKDDLKKLPKTAAKKIMRQNLAAEKAKSAILSNKLKITSDLKLGDCLDLIKEVPDNSVDLILTDMPFAVQEAQEYSGTGTISYNNTETNVSDEKTFIELWLKLAPEINRVLKHSSHVYMFFGMKWHGKLLDIFERLTDIELDDLPIIWNKGRASVMPKDFHYSSCYEPILFGMKPPKVRPLKKCYQNIINVNAIAGQSRIHPLQKPKELLVQLIENSTNPGDLVLDFFGGSGSIIDAARSCNRKSLAFEIDEGNYLRAQKFLELND